MPEYPKKGVFKIEVMVYFHPWTICTHPTTSYPFPDFRKKRDDISDMVDRFIGDRFTSTIRDLYIGQT